VRASFLPGRSRRVTERIADVAMHELDLRAARCWRRAAFYIAELQERLKLPRGIEGRANPKSSTAGSTCLFAS
jgi:dCTP deaminase